MLLFFTLKAIVLVLNYVIINEFSVCHSFLLTVTHHCKTCTPVVDMLQIMHCHRRGPVVK